ncbi:MAG: DUF4058 family protein [Isosphaeraceae bacterium]
MPVHDWTRVGAGIFHHFQLEWIGDLSRVLNRGLLPGDYYALAEQTAGGLGPDVLTLQAREGQAGPTEEPAGGLLLAATPPKVKFRARAEPDLYAAKARSVVIRHASNHRIVAVLEVVSPGNKSTRHAIRAILDKAVQLLRAGIHLVVVDLFPPGPRDPQGIHKLIWDEFIDNDFVLPSNRSRTLAAYIGGPFPEAFVEPVEVGQPLADVPLFLTPEVYVSVPLEATYQSAMEAVPAFWRDFLTAP